MTSTEILSCVFLSLKIGLLATAANLPPSLIVVYLLHRYRIKGSSLIEGIFNLPLVMPPVTTGFLLLIILGKNGLIGSYIYSFFGIRIAFTTLAAVLSAMIVSFPLLLRSLKVSIEMINPMYEKAAFTLGAGKISVFFRVTLPLMKPGIISGVVLAFARSLGEFGATITFAGNIEGVTRTIPLAVYSMLQIPGKEKEAAVLVAISACISLLAVILSSYLVKNNLKEGEGLQ